MPDKQTQIATYAAGASLAAIALVYVFSPHHFMDSEASTTSASNRKRCVVGLMNPANDCFINSVLQAMAGLDDLRIYLIRETHRRKLDGSEVYKQLVQDPARKNMPPWKLGGLQDGMITFGLKDVLDALNERPIYKKTISAGKFIAVLETAFKQRISRQQQDAQEFLQIVTERLCDEYHAGHRARDYARRNQVGTNVEAILNGDSVDEKLRQLSAEESKIAGPSHSGSEPQQASKISNGDHIASIKSYNEGGTNGIYPNEEAFPFEGVIASQIMCKTCNFTPKASTSTFSSLTLSVPEVSSTKLDLCLDQMFKVEHIDDFKCEKCRLVHALENFQHEISRSNSDSFKAKTTNAIEKLQSAIATDPEAPLDGVQLPDMRFAPKRRIEKSAKITYFPKILSIHLSRSMFGETRSAMKNSAKVEFPERWRVGGLQDFRFYKLSSVVCHKGSHNSGHYETFRRHNVTAPFSNPNTFQPAPAYSKPSTPIPSQISTPLVDAIRKNEEVSASSSTVSSTPELLSPASAASSSRSLPLTNGTSSGSSSRNDKERINSKYTAASNQTDAAVKAPRSAPRDSDTSSIRSLAQSARSKISHVAGKRRNSNSSSSTPGASLTTEVTVKTESNGTNNLRTSISDIVRGKRSRPSNRWWRISDEKVKEAKTAEVLGMQREVYLLFYELEKDDESTSK